MLDYIYIYIYTIICIFLLPKQNIPQLNIGIRTSVGIFRHRGTGCDSPTQKRHCDAQDLFSFGKSQGHSVHFGEGRKQTGSARPHAPSQDIRFKSLRLSRRKICLRMNAFAPKVKTFGAFLFKRFLFKAARAKFAHINFFTF